MIERQRPQSKVSVEDLLRLKRAERPEPEFWAKFEDQLRRKQLAAIVDKRPWWRRLSAASIAKISIPVGATAVAAFTLVSVTQREQLSAPEIASTPAISTSSSSLVAVSSDESNRSTVSGAGDFPDASALQADALAGARSETSLASAASSSNDPSSSVKDSIVAVQTLPEPSLAQVIIGLEGTSEATETGDVRPQYQAGEVSLLTSASIWSGSHAETGALVDAGSSVQVSSPRDDRRARLLASVESKDHGDLVAGNPRVAKSRDRIANRLAEQSLYDSISRLGLNGDSVSIKF